MVQEVQGRIGEGVQICGVWKDWPGRGETGDLLQNAQNSRFSRPGHHPVGAAVFLGVLRTQGGVDPSQDDRNAGEALPGQADGGGHPRIPVGHERGHQDGGGGGDPGQTLPESRLADAVAPVAPGDPRQGRGRRDDFLGVAPGTERPGPGMDSAQAVQEVDRISLSPQPPRQIEQPQRPGEKIVGREIIYPGVDQEERRTGVGQGNDLLYQFRFLLQQIGALTKLHEPSGGQIYQSLCQGIHQVIQ